MEPHVIIFILAVLLYLPLAGTLLYVWNKHGKGEKGVMIARAVFLIGSVIIFGCMLIV